MIASDSLFLLIKSLTMHEKMHLKIFYRGAKNDLNKYFKLFDIIAKQKEYDETKIRKEILFKQFPVAKLVLSNLILKFLRSYKSNEQPDLLAELQNIEILFKKGLLNACSKVIAKAKYEADLRQDFLILIQLLDWEKKIVNKWDKVDLSNEMKEIEAAELEALEKQKNTVTFRHLLAEITQIAKTSNTVRDENKKKLLNELINNTLLSNVENAISIQSKIAFYTIYRIYYRLMFDYHLTYNYSKELIRLFESEKNIDYLKDYNLQYCGVLINHSQIELMVNRKTEFKATFLKLQNLIKRHPELKQSTFPRTYISESIYIGKSLQLEKTDALIDRFEKESELYSKPSSISSLVTVYFNFAYLNLMREEYKKALYWINLVLTNIKKGVREDVYFGCYFVNLIIHFELKNEDLLNSTTMSFYRTLLKKESKYNYKYEETITRFILHEFPKIINETELIVSFKKLRNELITIITDTKEKQAIDDFDFISWLQSKIESRSFAEVFSENNKFI